MALTSTPVVVLDGTGASKPMISYNDGTNNTFAHPLLDATGAIISPAVITGQVFKTAAIANTAVTYTPGQVVGSLVNITTAARIAAGSGTIQNVTIAINVAGANQPYDVIFFNSIPTGTYNNTAIPTTTATDLPFIAGRVRCEDYYSFGSAGAILQASNSVPFALSTGTTLYALIIARGSQALTANTVTLSLTILQD